MHRYAVIDDKTHKVIGAIIWDGFAPWKPPIGHFVIRSDFADVGDQYLKKTDSFVGISDNRLKKNVILPEDLVEKRNLIIEPQEYK